MDSTCKGSRGLTSLRGQTQLPSFSFPTDKGHFPSTREPQLRLYSAHVPGYDFGNVSAQTQFPFTHLVPSLLSSLGCNVFYFLLKLSLKEKKVCWCQTWGVMVLLLHTRRMTVDNLLDSHTIGASFSSSVK